MPIREWPEPTRPRERLLDRGPASLSDLELLAILVGPGNSRVSAVDIALTALRDFGGLRELTRATTERLRASGVGPAATARILAACELTRRAAIEVGAAERWDTPDRCAAGLAPQFARLDRESVMVALLTNRNDLIRVSLVYAGTLTGTTVRTGELFAEAIRRNAARLVIAHNHPSGDPAPSPEDWRATEDAVSAGKLLGIEVVDHIVFGAGRWLSLQRLKNDAGKTW
jgi:DNA repair protein RadC